MKPPFALLIPAFLSPVQRAARRAINIAARLEAQGCHVLSAHAISARPLVRISAPPVGVLPTYGRLQEPGRGRRGYVATYVALVDGVRVEWEARP